MSETQIQPGGLPVPSATRVATDGTTITGDGTQEHPLVAVGGGGGGIAPVAFARVASDGSTLTGEGFASIVQSDVGVYELTLTGAARPDNLVVPVCSIMTPAAQAQIHAAVSEGVITVSTADAAGAAADSSFSIVVFVGTPS